MDRRGFLAAGAASLAGLSGCLGVIAEDAFDVGMTSNAFVPRESIAVPDHAPDWVPRGVPTHRATVGDPVVWENTGSRNHTVTAATPAHSTVEEMLDIEHTHGSGGHSGDEHHGEPTTTTESHDDHDHSHDAEPTTTTDSHEDHDHAHDSEPSGAGAADSAPYRLPTGAAFFASGGFDDEVNAVRSFVEELGGGGAISPGEQFVHTFEVPGWYHYYCIPHLAAGMVATVYVE
ncbi:plastocyanin/azurin family copper-binding protein [Halococcoides cellulosivorans]|uniref:Blue (type 1) copper domain-containing protein n=1 Tax=Halococcoides cellulosivorans TaxID=1679096 RepID=A0A2R4X108_9EURY|nr:plastocyanin/azurin family copper-binding protein [Halococcoides cellulosivorans]AWB27465.1 hypothetical protein HARCEL1_06970 [Halococcoides cellulosivorans]